MKTLLKSVAVWALMILCGVSVRADYNPLPTGQIGVSSGVGNTVGFTTLTYNPTTHLFTINGVTIDSSGNVAGANLTSGTNTFPTFNQNTTGTASNVSGTPALPNGTTATTQGTNDSSTKLASTAFINAASVSLTGTGSVNIDCSASRNFYTTVTGNVTYTFTNAYDGMSITVDVLGDASHTVAFTGPHWPNGGVAPTQTLSQHDVWTFKQINSRITGTSLQNVQ